MNGDRNALAASPEDLARSLSLRLPAEFHPLRYSFNADGTGMGDEFPGVLFDGPQHGELVTGMVMNIESYVGAPSGAEGVKLEERAVIGDDGPQILSAAPFDERLLD
ncbi:MAG: hypothetical protein ACR2FV_11845 [Ornithinimicrobium sp.]|uniref:hypothetical protein n=1 Tax=Ornithinimicrobium sp. TaxID=1977084 RepID=UPI003D9BB850